MSLKVKIRADSSQFERTMSKTKKSVRGFGKSLMGIKSALAGVAVAMGAAFASRKIFDFIASSSTAAANIENLTTQFTTLLGSASAAGDRMEEITKFAASTPFEISELAVTSKMLQTMGGSLLSTGEGLTLVGDAAAMAGRPLTEVGLSIGRVFGAITSGTSAGEMVNRLQELGLITGDVKRGFEELAAAQKKGTARILTQAEAIKLLKTVMKKTEGGMAALAETTDGKMSMVKDAIAQVKVSFGTGFNDGLKVALDAMSSGIPKVQGLATDMGNVIGLGISEAVNGDTDRLVGVGVLIGELIGGGIKIGMSEAWQSIGGFMNQRKNWITGEVHPDDLKQQDSDKKYMRRELVRELVESLQAGMRELTPSKDEITDPRGRGVPGQPGWEYAREGQPATIMDGERVVRILESIDQSLTKPFPN